MANNFEQLTSKAAALRAELNALEQQTKQLEHELEETASAEGHATTATVQARAAVMAAKVASGERAEALRAEASALEQQAQKQRESSSLMEGARAAWQGAKGAYDSAAVALRSVAVAGAAAIAIIAGLAVGSAAAEQHARAVSLLGDAYQTVQAQTAGAVSAEQALRAQQELTQSGYRVTAEQLGVVARAAREYALRTGGDAAQAQEQLTQALVNGEAGGLRRFGITVDSTRGRVANYHTALRQLEAQQRGQAISQRTQAEELALFSRGAQELGGHIAALITGYQGWVNQGVSLADGLRELNELMRDGWGGLERQQAQERQRLEERARLVARFRELGGNVTGFGGITNSMSNADVARLIANIERTGRANEQAAALETRITQQRAQARREEQTAQAAAERNDHSRDQQNAQRAEQARDLASRAAEAHRRLLDVQREGAFLGAEMVARTRSANETAAQADQRQTSAQAERNQRQQQYLSLVQASVLAVRAAAQETATRTLVRPYEDALRQAGDVAALEARAAEAHARIVALGAEIAPLARAIANQTATRADVERVEALNATTQALRQQEQQLLATADAQRRLHQDWLRAALDQDRRSAEDRVTRQQLRPFQRELGGEGVVNAEQRVHELEARLATARSAAAEAAARFNRTGNVEDGREADMLRRRADAVRDVANGYRDMAEAQREAQDASAQVGNAVIRSLQLQTTAAQHYGSFTEAAIGSVTGAFKQHFAALIQGKETAGEAFKGMLADVLSTLAAEAAVRALFATATGIFQLATYQYAQAAQSFTAAGVFAAVAAVAGGASYGLATSSPSSGAQATPPSNNSSQAGGSQSAQYGAGGAAGPTNIYFYSGNMIDTRESVERGLARVMRDARRQGELVG